MKKLTKQIIISKALFWLWISFVCISCNQNKYPYEKGIAQYFNEVHKIGVDKFNKKLVYILPINECVSCNETTINLNMLNNLPIDKNLLILIVGLEENSIFKQKVNKIKNICLFDNNARIYNYQTGLQKPLLLKYENGKIKYYLTVKDTKLIGAKNYIEKNAN